MASTKEIESYGFRFKKDGRALTGEITLREAAKFYRDMPGLTLSEKNNEGHQNKWVEENTPRRIEWCGGTREGLLDAMAGKVDLSHYQEVRNRLAGLPGWLQLKSKLARVSPKRKRCVSEHDGEWQFDRRYEIAAFSATQRAMTHARTMELVADVAVNSDGTAAAITEYGAFVWSVAQLVEAQGITCGVTLRFQTCRLFMGNTTDLTMSVRVKRPGEYITPALLAAVLSSNFYRRVTFATFVAAGEWADLKVCRGLGSAYYSADPISFGAGTLHMTPDAHAGMTAQLERELLKALA